MKLIFPASLLALVWCASSGCISTDRTYYRDAERIKVSFENDAAGRMFYEALSKAAGANRRSESKTQISIPIILDHKERTVDGDNLLFNDAVRRCDSNGDGKITELEARIYSETVAK
ncbi:MAG: hypothetical protein WCS94_15570 [Verrucomicrobiota bacterium]